MRGTRMDEARSAAGAVADFGVGQSPNPIRTRRTRRSSSFSAEESLFSSSGSKRRTDVHSPTRREVIPLVGILRRVFSASALTRRRSRSRVADLMQILLPVVGFVGFS